MSRLFESLYLREEQVKRHKQIEQTNPTARAKGESLCCNSGVCCWRRPGQLVPDDVPVLAKFLGITERELFEKHLVVDRINGNLALLPARKHQPGGCVINWRESYSMESPCKFLDENNRCSVHDAKPTSCREFGCWKDDNKYTPAFPEKKLLELGWAGLDPDDMD